MSSARKFGLIGAVCALAAVAVSRPARAQETILGGYDANNNTMILVINNSGKTDFTNVSLTETLIADPSITDSITIGTIKAGTSATSDKDFFFPITFGD